MASLKDRIVAAEQQREADSAAFFARAETERRAKQKELLPWLISALEASEGRWTTLSYRVGVEWRAFAHFPAIEDCTELQDWLRAEGLWLSHRGNALGSQYRLLSMPPRSRVMRTDSGDGRIFREGDQ